MLIYSIIFLLLAVFTSAQEGPNVPVDKSVTENHTSQTKRNEGSHSASDNSVKRKPSPEMTEAATKIISALNTNALALNRFTSGMELSKNTELDIRRFEQQLAEAGGDVEVSHIIVEASEAVEKTSNVLAAMQSNTPRMKPTSTEISQVHAPSNDRMARILSVVALLGAFIGAPLICRFYLRRGLKKAGLM